MTTDTHAMHDESQSEHHVSVDGWPVWPVDHAMHDESQSEHHGIGHVIPVPVLIAVFLTLIVLTVVTVAASYLPLGELEIWVAMGIATVKAGLVAAYFMHLRYDNPLNAVLFVIGLLFVGLFVGFVLMDAEQYRSDLIKIPAVRGN